MTINLDTKAIKPDLRMIFVVITVFLVVVNICHSTLQVKRFLAAIAIIGDCVAALALAQDIVDNEKLYWLVDPGVDRAYSGSFVNHNHYGRFINLSIGKALGLILVKLRETFTGKMIAVPIILEHLRSLVKLLPEADKILDSILEERMCLRLRSQFLTAKKLTANESVFSRTVFADNPVIWVHSRCVIGCFLQTSCK